MRVYPRSPQASRASAARPGIPSLRQGRPRHAGRRRPAAQGADDGRGRADPAAGANHHQRFRVDPEQLPRRRPQAESKPVIPPRPNRRRPHAYDRHLYKERNQIERCFAKLKQFRRVATRYDKLLINFLGFVTMATIVIWLK